MEPLKPNPRVKIVESLIPQVLTLLREKSPAGLTAALIAEYLCENNDLLDTANVYRAISKLRESGQILYSMTAQAFYPRGAPPPESSSAAPGATNGRPLTKARVQNGGKRTIVRRKPGWQTSQQVIQPPRDWKPAKHQPATIETIRSGSWLDVHLTIDLRISEKEAAGLGRAGMARVMNAITVLNNAKAYIDRGFTGVGVSGTKTRFGYDRAAILEAVTELLLERQPMKPLDMIKPLLDRGVVLPDADQGESRMAYKLSMMLSHAGRFDGTFHTGPSGWRVGPRPAGKG